MSCCPSWATSHTPCPLSHRAGPSYATSLTPPTKRPPPHHFIRLNKQCRADLSWWLEFGISWGGASTWPPPDPSVTCFTDASGSWGCGGILGEHPFHWFQLAWPAHWSNYHIAAKELVPVVIAAALWGPQWAGRRVLFRSNNQSVVAAVNSGSSRDHTMAHLLRCLFFFSASWQFTLVAKHIPGVQNFTADALSRDRAPTLPLLVPQLIPLFHIYPPPYRTSSWPPMLAGRSSLAQGVQVLYAHGIAGNTTRTYDSGKRRFLRFCEAAGLTPLPLTEEVFCLFVANLMQERLQFTSIRTYLFSVRHLQITAGLPDPFTPNAFPRLSYVLRGAWRTRALRPDRRLPITPRLLSLLRNSWAGSSPSYESRLLWAACCLGFFGFLRVGEFTARDGSSPLNPDIISVHDISRAPGDPPNYICVHLRVSKTDPFGRGVHMYLGRTASVICPVAAILSFMTIRPSHLTGPLLRFLDGSTLTRTFLISTVKRALATAGIDPTRYSGHSFRIGAATSAALAGMPDHTIKMLGRWESSAYALYVRTPAEELASVSARLLSPRPSTTSTISPGPTH